MINNQWSITLIGAGNIGFHLGKHLFKKGFRIHQVFSRDWQKAHNLASNVQAEAIQDLKFITPEADLYILAVHDDAIAEVAAQLEIKDKLVVHTSGATPSTVLEPYFERYGIFYPLQTFSITKSVDFQRIPICIYAKKAADLDKLEEVARLISPSVHHIDDEQRKILHVAAVFVNNFANYIFHVGYDIVEKADISFDLLRPLIKETAAKIQANAPATMQTGPAIRNDQATIDQHLQYLELYPDYKLLYEIFTQNIQEKKATSNQ